VRQPVTHSAPLIWTEPAPPPQQRALGRESIVAAAIDLADEAGASALTMKRVAERIGPYSPMSLYRYVYSKDGLIDLMLDAATAEIEIPARPGRSWRKDLRTLAAGTRAMTRRHPWFSTLIHTRPPVGPHLMGRVEFMLAVLTRHGATVAEAMTYSALIDRHIFGFGLQEAEEANMSRRHGLDDTATLLAEMAAVQKLAAADHPQLASWLAQPSGPTMDEQFDLGLGFLIDGIAGLLRGKPST
jgi:AcrR family transcriptional regulator